MPALIATYKTSPAFKVRLAYGFTTETKEFWDRVTVNGGTVSASTLKFIDTYVRAQKNIGIWERSFTEYPFVGNNLNAALTPLKVGGGNSILTNVNFVAGDYSEASGLQGKDLAYLKTGVTNWLLGSFSGNLITMGLYYSGTPGSSYAIGSTSASPRWLLIVNFMGLTKDWGDTTDDSTGNVEAVGYSGNLCVSVSRTSLSRADIYINGISRGNRTGAKTVTMTSNSEFLLGNRQGLNAGAYFQGKYKHVILGASMDATQNASWYTNVHALQTSLGRQNV